MQRISARGRSLLSKIEIVIWSLCWNEKVSDRTHADVFTQRVSTRLLVPTAERGMHSLAKERAVTRYFYKCFIWEVIWARKHDQNCSDWLPIWHVLHHYFWSTCQCQVHRQRVHYRLNSVRKKIRNANGSNRFLWNDILYITILGNLTVRYSSQLFCQACVLSKKNQQLESGSITALAACTIQCRTFPMAVVYRCLAANSRLETFKTQLPDVTVLEKVRSNVSMQETLQDVWYL